jgi:hypothetical protein
MSAWLSALQAFVAKYRSFAFGAQLAFCLTLFDADPPAGLSCLGAVLIEKAVELIAAGAYQELKFLIASFNQGGNMACVDRHSGTVQGPGLCCQQVASGALPRTIGAAVLVTDSGGHCGHCMVVGSKSKKHPGVPVLAYRRGNPLGTTGCPISSRGCCALNA